MPVNPFGFELRLPDVAMELFGRSERLHVWLLEGTQQSAWPGLRHAETMLMSAPSKELKPFFSPGEPAVNR